MLGADSDADESGGDSSQEGPIPEDPERPGELGFSGTGEYAADHAILDGNLELLRELGGEFAALLNAFQIAGLEGAVP